MRQALLIVIVGLLAAGVAVATGQGEAAEGGAELEVSPPGTYPIVEEPVTYELLVGYSEASQSPDFEENPFTIHYTDLTNVRFEFDATASGQLAEKRNLVLASGDYPDVMMNMQLSIAQAYQLGENGVVHDLGPAIDEYAENLQAVFAQEPWVQGQMTAPSGGRYFLPWINSGCFHCEYSQRVYVYQPWLDQLGLDRPETTAEFEQMLIAFAEQDPNGNGEADEIPMMGAASGWRPEIYGWLMNAFTYTNPESSPYLQWADGSVEFVADTEEWKDGLRYMNRLYEEGLIAPESFVQSDSQMKVFGEAEDPVVGVFTGGHLGMFSALNSESNRWLEYQPLAPIAGPDGHRSAPHFPHQVGAHMVVFQSVEQPEIMVRWADWFYTFEGFMEGVKGWEEGVHYRKLDADSGLTGLTGDPALYEIFEDAQSGIQDNVSLGWENSTVRYWNRAFFEGQATTGMQTMGPILIEAADEYSQYDTGQAMPVVIFPPDVAPEIAELEATIEDTVESFIARFVTGEMDIDASWDAYLRELNNLGVDRYVELYDEYAVK